MAYNTPLHERKNTEFHLQFQDEDDEFMKSLQSLRGQLKSEPLTVVAAAAAPSAPPVHPSPFKPLNNLPRSPLEGDGAAARLNAENLVLAGKVAKLSQVRRGSRRDPPPLFPPRPNTSHTHKHTQQDLVSSKSEITQLKQASRASSRSPKKSALSPLNASSSPQTPAPSVEVLSKLRSERGALRTKVTALEAQRDEAEALLQAEREARKAEVDELKEKVKRAAAAADLSSAMSVGLAKREGEVESRFAKQAEGEGGSGVFTDMKHLRTQRRRSNRPLSRRRLPEGSGLAALCDLQPQGRQRLKLEAPEGERRCEGRRGGKDLQAQGRGGGELPEGARRRGEVQAGEEL